jgi:cytoskeletal protein CcmA (bactofilin family)
MSTVKISELALISQLNANTQNTLFVAVDVPSGVTGKFTGRTLAQGLYSNEILNVGTNPVVYPGVVAQFSGNSTSVATYLQVNFQNFTSNGSTDYVASTSDSTNANSFIDMGISGKDYSDPVYHSAFKPYDGYVYVGGPTTTSYSGNLILGTASTRANIVFMVGGTMTENVVGYITQNGYDLLSNVSVRGALSTTTGLRFSDGSTQNTASNPAVYSQAAYTQANTATTIGQAAYVQANTSNTVAIAAYVQANTATTIGQAAHVQANTSNTVAIAAYVQANTSNTVAIASYVQANTATTIGQAAYVQANTSNTVAIAAYVQANTATIIGQAAFTKANNALANTTGTFAGNLTVTGNVIVIGQTSSTGPITTSNLIVSGITTLTGNVIMDASTYMAGGVTVNSTMVIANSRFSATEAALTITAAGSSQTPTQAGTLMQLTSKANTPARVLIDSFGTSNTAYPVIAGRNARGTVTSPTATQNNDILLRIAGNSYGTTGYAPFGDARIDFVATENHSDTNRGSRIRFWNTPTGSNVVNEIASFNADSIYFTGVISPEKGFIYTPRVPAGNQTAITINYETDSMIKANLVADLTVSHSNFVTGKVVEMWLVNTGGTTRTVTHGLTALNSTTNSTTFTIPATSSAYLKFFSIAGDLANTFVSVQSS